MSPEEQPAWLEEYRDELELIILNARLLGHVGSKGSGYAADALDLADDGDYRNAQRFRGYAIERWTKFITTGS